MAERRAGPPDAPALTSLQTWMQHAIVSPRHSGPPAADVLAATPGLSAERRLGIYRHGYRRRLLEAMHALYPVLASLLGAEVFEELALGHVEARPSRSPNLSHLGAGFADHLARHRPVPEEPPEPWVRIIIDLARYENAFAEVYDGPGTEEGDGARPVQPPGPQDSARPGGAVPWFAPCLRTLSASAPVHRYHTAVRRGEAPEPLTPRTCHLVLSRHHYRVTCTELPAAEHRLLTAALAGTGYPAADGAGRHLLDRWAAKGWLERAAPGDAGRPVPSARPRNDSRKGTHHDR